MASKEALAFGLAAERDELREQIDNRNIIESRPLVWERFVIPLSSRKTPSRLVLPTATTFRFDFKPSSHEATIVMRQASTKPKGHAAMR